MQKEIFVQINNVFFSETSWFTKNLHFFQDPYLLPKLEISQTQIVDDFLFSTQDVNSSLFIPWKNHTAVWGFLKMHLDWYKAYEEADKAKRPGMERGLRPGSLKAYSLSLGTYLDFLIGIYNPTLPEEDSLDTQQCDQLKGKIVYVKASEPHCIKLPCPLIH